MNSNEIFKIFWEKNGSDLHISTGDAVSIRIHKHIIRQSEKKLTKAEVEEIIFGLMPPDIKEKFMSTNEADFAVTIEPYGRARVNAFMSLSGLGMALRRIPSEVPTFEQLNSPLILKELCNKENGLILVTGPTGSGKSTTLAAMINCINETKDYHILTIEDPIEFVHIPKKSIITQREISTHTNTFNAALRSAMREDPNVILIGELRDLETIRLALVAAETGHLVFGTLHTRSAAKSIDRIINVFPGDERERTAAMLAESLRGIVSQNLLSGIVKPVVAIQEIMINTPAIQNLIREQKSHQIQSAIQTGQQHGMIALENAVEQLLENGSITEEVSKTFLKNIN